MLCIKNSEINRVVFFRNMLENQADFLFIEEKGSSKSALQKVMPFNQLILRDENFFSITAFLF